MNIYEQIEKCFPGKSVSLHFIHNKDKSITTLIEPKITDDDEKFNHPITFTTLPDDSTDIANQLLEKAFEMIKDSKIPDSEGERKIEGVEESAEQFEDEEGGSKKKTAKVKPVKKAVVKKNVPAKKEVKKTEPKKVEKKEPKAAVVKPSKEETARIAKIENAFTKFNDVFSKQDYTLAKFWFGETRTLLKDFDNRYDDQFLKMQQDYGIVVMALEGMVLKKEHLSTADESAKKVEEYEKENQESMEHNEETVVENKEETKTEPSNDGDAIPMPN